VGWPEGCYQADPEDAHRDNPHVQELEEKMIVLLIASLFADKLSEDVDGSSVMHLAMFEMLFDAVAVMVIIALIRNALFVE
jgi:hypothetical protein